MAKSSNKLGIEPAGLDLVGHDLRSALSDVVGGIDVLDLDAFDDKTRAQLERVRSAGRSVARIIHALMDPQPDASQDATGFRFRAFLREFEFRWAGRAAALGLDFALEIRDEVPTRVAVDRLRFERVLSNLADNAIKYTEQGRITVSVDLRTGDELRISVKDSGPGFTDVALRSLFERRSRAQSKGKPGQGLGLHIAKDLADQLGGWLMVANAEDAGAIVTLLLPSDAWRPTQSVAVDELPDLSGTHVLVAEDIETNQLIITQMLTKLGASYTLAADGTEAMACIRAEDYDVALIDIEMPGYSGIDVIKSIRARDGAASEIPILAITAYVLNANREAIYAAGASGLIAKPIMSIEEFGSAISVLLRKSQTPSVTNLYVEDEVDGSRLEELLRISGPDAAEELLVRLKSDFSHVKIGISQGLDKKDVGVLRAKSHVLISLAGALGVDPLLSHAQELNSAVHRSDWPVIEKSSQKILEQIDPVLDMLRMFHIRARVA